MRSGYEKGVIDTCDEDGRDWRKNGGIDSREEKEREGEEEKRR